MGALTRKCLAGRKARARHLVAVVGRAHNSAKLRRPVFSSQSCFQELRTGLVSIALYGSREDSIAPAFESVLKMPHLDAASVMELTASSAGNECK